MTTERWKQIQELFSAALARESGERSAFLKEACADDDDLLAEVKSFLAADGDTLSLLKAPIPPDFIRGLLAEQYEPLVGRQIGRFKIIREIGEGALGRVYLAQDTKLDRPVALKFLLKNFTLNEERLRRFEQEAKTASSLSHPNIVTIYGLEQEGSDHYIVMEYVEGKTLRQYLADLSLKPYPLKIRESLDISIQVAEALAYSHDKGIIHRDIKPENIMLPYDGRLVKVLDFGIAKVTAEISRQELGPGEESSERGRQTTPGTLLGTVNYMSPEQARAITTVDAQTDVWSLGVVFYEMITGRAPFEGQNTWDVIASIHANEPLPLSKFLREVPDELQRVVSKALAKDKSKRYREAVELQNDLEKLWRELGREAAGEHIVQSLGDVSSVRRLGRNVLWSPKRAFREDRHMKLPDILTPGLPQRRLVDILTPHVGTQLAERLSQLGETSITAVEEGNFDLHVSTGQQIEAEAQGFPEVEAAGRYFAAEGYRLQADLEIDPVKKRLLLQRAAEQYELSLEKYPDNARAIRGLARVYEVHGEYETALNKFRQAEGLALFQLSSDDLTNIHLHLSHEILRITRHYIHCILDIIATNPQSIWHRENKKRELEGYVIASENLHREKMPLFKDREQWSRIEWFMGLVFFGKAWGRLGNLQRKTKCLVDALWVRRRMMSEVGTLTQVERANIIWWLSVALSEPRDVALAGVEDLAQAVGRAGPTEVLRKIDDILFPFMPPWQHLAL